MEINIKAPDGGTNHFFRHQMEAAHRMSGAAQHQRGRNKPMLRKSRPQEPAFTFIQYIICIFAIIVIGQNIQRIRIFSETPAEFLTGNSSLMGQLTFPLIFCPELRLCRLIPDIAVNLFVIGGIHRFRKMDGAVDQFHIAAGRFCTGRCAISCHIGGQPVMDLLPSCKERSILR